MAPNVLHELKTLVQSMHSLVVVETIEEERVDDLLRALAADLKVPLFTWTVTRGLQRIDGVGMIHATADPRMVLRHLSTLTVQGIFSPEDLSAYLNDAQAVKFARTRSTIVLSGAEIEQAIVSSLYRARTQAADDGSPPEGDRSNVAVVGLAA
jgi:hypothetical protein